MGSFVALVLIGMWVAVFAAFVVSAFRQPTERRVAAFANIYAVPVTTLTASLIADALSWSRRWRVAGGIVAALAWWAWSDDTWPANFLVIAAGAAIGSLLAELRHLAKSRRWPQCCTQCGPHRSVRSWVGAS